MEFETEKQEALLKLVASSTVKGVFFDRGDDESVYKQVRDSFGDKIPTDEEMIEGLSVTFNKFFKNVFGWDVDGNELMLGEVNRYLGNGNLYAEIPTIRTFGFSSFVLVIALWLSGDFVRVTQQDFNEAEHQEVPPYSGDMKKPLSLDLAMELFTTNAHRDAVSDPCNVDMVIVAGLAVVMVAKSKRFAGIRDKAKSLLKQDEKAREERQKRRMEAKATRIIECITVESKPVSMAPVASEPWVGWDLKEKLKFIKKLFNS